jgi:hypothetical protein
VVWRPAGIAKALRKVRQVMSEREELRAQGGLPAVDRPFGELEPHDRMEVLTDLALTKSYEFLSAPLSLEEAAEDMGKRRLYLAQQAKADFILALVVRIRDEQKLRQSRKEDEAIATILGRLREGEAKGAVEAPQPKRKAKSP